MLWVVLQTSYELCDWMFLKADLIHCVEQWEPGRKEETLLSAETVMDGLIVFSKLSVCVVLLLNLLVNEVFVLEDEINLSCCRWSLQLLTIQHLFLQLLDGLRRNRT